jgi:RNA polymerase sigma-70 factor (ECF subfamily)
VDADIALLPGMADDDPFAARLAAETPRVRAWLARLIPRNDVDDLVQETLTRAWRYRSTFDAGRELGPWLRGTALRVAFDHRARLQRRPPMSSLEIEPAARATQAADESMDASESVEFLLVRLDASERDVLVRFHRLGQSIAEIAAALDRPVGTVKSQLHRARRKLARDPRGEERA